MDREFRRPPAELPQRIQAASAARFIRIGGGV
jgi:hypothetical protein